MNKKASHVGMILSFVVFVVFLLFLYTIIEPSTKVEKDKQDVLDFLKIELTEQVSSDMTTVTLSLDEEYTSDKTCLNIDHAEPSLGDLEVVVKDKENLPVSSSSSSISLTIDWDSSTRFFKAYYYSQDDLLSGLSISMGSSEECANPTIINDYSFGLIRTKKYIFEAKIIELINDYENNYEELKKLLKISESDEFSFSFMYKNNSWIGTQETDVQTNIYVDEIPIQYVDTEANINSGFINIRVW